jgi:hypothetical protein
MKHLTPVWFGLMLSSGLIASSAIAAPTVLSTHNFPVQQLTSESISTEQSTQLAAVLIGISSFGLPCSLLLTLLLHNQIEAQRTKMAAQLVRVRVKSKS